MLSFPEQLFFMTQPDNRTLLSDPSVVIEGKRSQETWNFSPGISLLACIASRMQARAAIFWQWSLVTSPLALCGYSTAKKVSQAQQSRQLTLSKIGRIINNIFM